MKSKDHTKQKGESQKSISKIDNFNLKVISIGVGFSDKCLDLDHLAFNGLWTKSQWEKELSDKSKLCLGVFMNSKIIALVSGTIILDQLEINMLAVDPSKRRLGLGEKVLSSLLNRSRKLGAHKVTLEVKSQNFAAKKLYKKLGFKIIGNREKYYKDGSNALIFGLNFDP